MAAIIRLRREHLDAMVRHALADAPLECCGVVARRDGVSDSIHPAANTEASAFRFNIDPREYLKIERAIDAAGGTVAGFYHSHTGPKTPAEPSETDVRAMTGAGFEPPFVHFVVGLADSAHPEVRAWQIEGGHKTEQEYEVID